MIPLQTPPTPNPAEPDPTGIVGNIFEDAGQALEYLLSVAPIASVAAMLILIGGIGVWYVQRPRFQFLEKIVERLLDRGDR